MKNKLFAVLLCVLLAVSLFPNAMFAEDGPVDIILTVNSEAYGTLTSDDVLTGLNPGDEIELTAAANEAEFVHFVKWIIYKGEYFEEVAEEGVDYSFAENAAKTRMTILCSESMKVMAVFQGDVVGLNPYRHYEPMNMSNATFRIVQRDNPSNVWSTNLGISGWNNDPNEPITSTVVFDFGFFYEGDPFQYPYFSILKTMNGAANTTPLLASGAHYDFPLISIYSETDGRAIIEFPEDFEWLDYTFRIVDENNNTLKNVIITFKWSGLAVIDAKNGFVKAHDVLYGDGERARIFMDEQTIEAVPEVGYEFAGWEISGIELDDPMENPLDFFMPYDDPDVVIKAKFEKKDVASDITVITGSPKFVENENYSIDGNVLTVSYDVPCRVGYIGADGKFVSISAVPIEGRENTYSFTVDNSEVTEIFLVVKGDANGNGGFDGGDITRAKAASLGKVALSDARLFAADANGNGSFDGGDITRMKAVSLGKKSFDW